MRARDLILITFEKLRAPSGLAIGIWIPTQVRMVGREVFTVRFGPTRCDLRNPNRPVLQFDYHRFLIRSAARHSLRRSTEEGLSDQKENTSTFAASPSGIAIGSVSEPHYIPSEACGNKPHGPDLGQYRPKYLCAC